MRALFAFETEFWIEFTRQFWLDRGYTHPIFSPFIHISYEQFDQELSIPYQNQIENLCTTTK